MKRWTLRIVVFLLLLGGGAIVNVAVAWGLTIGVAYSDSGVTGGNYGRSSVGESWIVCEFRSFGSQLAISHYSSATYFGGGPDDDKREIRQPRFPSWWRAPTTRPTNMNDNVAADARGWPSLSLYVEFVAPQMNYETSLSHGGLQLPRKTAETRAFGVPLALPLIPLWPGFAINTVFYAGVLWMVFAAPFALRRRSRRRRGLCVKCGYDLRGSADARACPECGATR